MALQEEPVGTLAEVEELAKVFGAFARLQGAAEHHHVHRTSRLLAQQRVLGAHQQEALSGAGLRCLRHLGHLAADDVGALLQSTRV